MNQADTEQTGCSANSINDQVIWLWSISEMDSLTVIVISFFSFIQLHHKEITQDLKNNAET